MCCLFPSCSDMLNTYAIDLLYSFIQYFWWNPIYHGDLFSFMLRNCCMARMLRGEGNWCRHEQVCQRRKSVNGLDTALYENILIIIIIILFYIAP